MISLITLVGGAADGLGEGQGKDQKDERNQEISTLLDSIYSIMIYVITY